MDGNLFFLTLSAEQFERTVFCVKQVVKIKRHTNQKKNNNNVMLLAVSVPCRIAFK